MNNIYRRFIAKAGCGSSIVSVDFGNRNEENAFRAQYSRTNRTIEGSLYLTSKLDLPQEYVDSRTLQHTFCIGKIREWERQRERPLTSLVHRTTTGRMPTSACGDCGATGHSNTTYPPTWDFNRIAIPLPSVLVAGTVWPLQQLWMSAAIDNSSRKTPNMAEVPGAGCVQRGRKDNGSHASKRARCVREWPRVVAREL